MWAHTHTWHSQLQIPPRGWLKIHPLVICCSFPFIGWEFIRFVFGLFYDLSGIRNFHLIIRRNRKLLANTAIFQRII